MNLLRINGQLILAQVGHVFLTERLSKVYRDDTEYYASALSLNGDDYTVTFQSKNGECDVKNYKIEDYIKS